MTTFILAAVIFGLVMAGMAVGVIFQDKPIKGSCGGLANVGLGGTCEICGSDTSKCDEETDGVVGKTAGKTVDVSMAYDAASTSTKK